MNPLAVIRNLQNQTPTQTNSNPGQGASALGVDNNYFNFFTVAQTYNGESFAAGDILIGSNTANTDNFVYKNGVFRIRYGTSNIITLNSIGIRLVDGGVAFQQTDITVAATPVDLTQGGGEVYSSYLRITSAPSAFTVNSIVNPLNPNHLLFLFNNTAYAMTLTNGGVPPSGSYWPINTGGAPSVPAGGIVLLLGDDANNQWLLINNPASSAGASTGLAFVTIGNDGTLSAERALTGTANQITVTDNGANSTVVLSTPQNIGTSSNVQFGAITATGAFTSIGIDDNSNAVAVTIDTTERLLTGYATSIPYRASSTNNTIQVANSNTTNSIAGFQAIRFSADTGGARLTLGKSRDTAPGSHTIVQSGDELALIDFIADDGTLHLAAASITAKVDGTPGTNDVPGRLEFHVTADGAAAPTLALTINNDKSATFKNFIKSDSATAGIGYATGAGGTVTQATSKSTGVTLSKVSGQITMNNAALAADTTVSFTLTNTAIAATDVLVMNHVSGGTAGSYLLNAQCGAGSASINVRNITAGSLSEAIVIAFVVIKGVTA